jgi:uncharacterized protein DUF1707
VTDLLRVSDAEREEIAERLRRAHADGRLDTAELEERVERCYAAKTRAELEPLVADLPSPRRRRSQQRRVSGQFGFPPILLVVLLLAVFAFAGPGHVPFPLFPILFFVMLRFGRRSYRHR